ncbi:MULTISPECIES: hypothetical protein [Pirellulaceae]|uniref:hypothetical protein n=1 Tax=Pirellulaceae TaxID=2691357 RepID=UPI001304A550|nr:MULTISPECIES: hypothetical protein [Pirellulaceae]
MNQRITLLRLRLIDIARHRLTRVQSEIKNLIEVLKALGKFGIASVGTELKELEAERD